MLAPHSRRFTTHEVADSAGISARTLEAWLLRGGVVLGSGDSPAKGTGYTHQFTANRAVQVALTAVLAGHGLTVRQAGVIACAFTDMGNHPEERDAAGELREPGALYQSGRTVLIAHPGENCGRVVNVRPDTLEALLFNIPGGGVRDVAAVVNVNAIVSRVHARLTPPCPAVHDTGAGLAAMPYHAVPAVSQV